MISSFLNWESLKSLIILIPVFLFSISFHEYAHAWVAYRLGDPTAQYAGRLTLNPIRHFDLFGFIMLMFVRFGWAKPVPVNPNNFKNSSRGMLFTSMAGPISNIILSVSTSFLYSLLFTLVSLFGVQSEFWGLIWSNSFNILIYFVYINIGLAVFNLIPIYPLDGSGILEYFMPPKYHGFMARFGQYIQIAFLLIVILTSYVGNFISFVQYEISNLLISFWRLVFTLIL